MPTAVKTHIWHTYAITAAFQKKLEPIISKVTGGSDSNQSVTSKSVRAHLILLGYGVFTLHSPKEELNTKM